jgi:hypothetical protein
VALGAYLTGNASSTPAGETIIIPPQQLTIEVEVTFSGFYHVAGDGKATLNMNATGAKILPLIDAWQGVEKNLILTQSLGARIFHTIEVDKK